MYSTDFVENEFKYLAAGIHENVTLLSIAVENSKRDGTGSDVLRFHFEKDGFLFTHTEFPVKADAKPEAFQYLGGRIKHILGSFVPKDKLIFSIAETNPEKAWRAFMNKVIEIAGKAYEGQLFRIKIVLNKSDYQTFPGFPPFMQNMKEPNALKITAKDKINSSVPDKDDTQEAGIDWTTPVETTAIPF